MIRILVEVGNDTARFLVAAHADNLQQAVEFVKDRYPSSDARVVFPLDPEMFFVENPAAKAAGLVELELPTHARSPRSGSRQP
jgi:hypothetical protein